MALKILAAPALRDNYIWHVAKGDRCLVVDPGEAMPVITLLHREHLQPEALLVTHHHWDHTDGVAELQDRYGIPVYGPDDERVPGEVTPVHEGENAFSALGLDFDVLDIPCHTRSHVAFVTEGMLFCGDMLFSVGCGRMFEGDAAQMLASLDKLAALPDPTRVYCGHEYTVANCRFALEVEPDNEALRQHAAEAERLRAAGRPTLPSTIGDERRINPFLRVREPGVEAAARERLGREPESPAEVMHVIRVWKDEYQA